MNGQHFVLNNCSYNNENSCNDLFLGGTSRGPNSSSAINSNSSSGICSYFGNSSTSTNGSLAISGMMSAAASSSTLPVVPVDGATGGGGVVGVRSNPENNSFSSSFGMLQRQQGSLNIHQQQQQQQQQQMQQQPGLGAVGGGGVVSKDASDHTESTHSESWGTLSLGAVNVVNNYSHTSLDNVTAALTETHNSMGSNKNQQNHCAATSLGELDVMCGRGKIAFHHAGNVYFREQVSKWVEPYQAAEKRVGKPQIVQSIIDHIHQRGGKFKKKETKKEKIFRVGGSDSNSNSDVWIELSAHQAREKVSHAIRDAHNLAKKQQKLGSDVDMGKSKKKNWISTGRESTPVKVGGDDKRWTSHKQLPVSQPPVLDERLARQNSEPIVSNSFNLSELNMIKTIGTTNDYARIPVARLDGKLDPHHQTSANAIKSNGKIKVPPMNCSVVVSAHSPPSMGTVVEENGESGLQECSAAVDDDDESISYCQAMGTEEQIPKHGAAALQDSDSSITLGVGTVPDAGTSLNQFSCGSLDYVAAMDQSRSRIRKQSILPDHVVMEENGMGESHLGMSMMECSMTSLGFTGNQYQHPSNTRQCEETNGAGSAQEDGQGGMTSLVDSCRSLDIRELVPTGNERTNNNAIPNNKPIDQHCIDAGGVGTTANGGTNLRSMNQRMPSAPALMVGGSAHTAANCAEDNQDLHHSCASLMSMSNHGSGLSSFNFSAD